MDTELGCNDIDECLTNKNACKENTFCVNSPGSHSCLSNYIFHAILDNV